MGKGEVRHGELMKENKEVNESFIAFHEEMAVAGKTREQIIAAAIPQFNLGPVDTPELRKRLKTQGITDSAMDAHILGMRRHTYRAWVARLADLNKYGGRFSERMKRFQTQPKKKDIAVKTEPEGGPEPIAVVVAEEEKLGMTMDA